MPWIVFSYSLPSKAQSSPRVTLWRRLRRLGAIAPTGGVYVLPAREDCEEAFQWLTQEVQQAHGEALMMHVERFEGLTDAHLIELFRRARTEDYADIEAQAVELEQCLTPEIAHVDRTRVQETLAKLRRQHADVARIDFFDAPEGTFVASRLSRIAQALASNTQEVAGVARASLAAYRDRRWVTRPRPHVDRLACIWLIRRFINPTAVVRYATTPEPDEVAFDMRDGEIRHQGSLCTFETMLTAFGLHEPGLPAMAELIHEIDLRDGQYAHPEAAGIDAILQGWLLARFSDTDLEAHGVALFEGLYNTMSRDQNTRRVAGRTHACETGNT